MGHGRQLRLHGWSIVFVEGDRREPSMAYTVGLTRWQHPELLASAVDTATGARLLNTLGRAVRPGSRFVAGEWVDLDGRDALHLLAVRDPRHLVVAQELLGEPAELVPTLQVAWADREGRWPWDPAVRWRRTAQRLFGEPADPAGPARLSAS